ncbi:MAG: flavocytochrome c [Tissierellia bacterium]|nr:flavocytochrome c [Tissierellia bacterium]
MKKFSKLITLLLVLTLVLVGCSKTEMKKVGENKKEPSNTTEVVGKKELGADVIVIGAGGAGMSAAIEAHDAGASVIILEKMPIIGGNTIRSEGGMNAAETKPQKDQGIGDSVEKMIVDTIKGGKEKNNPELVKFFAENSKDAIEWLTTLGMDVTEVAQGAGASEKRMHRSKGGAKVGSVLVPVLEKNLNDRGIKVLLNTEATKIIMENNKVAGVEAIDKNGNKIVFKANAIVMATGGFGANEEVFSNYRNDLAGFKTTNHPGATGDGIKMAQEVGADLVDMNEIQTNPTVEVSSTTVISESVRGNGAILVNQEAKRFISEMETRDILSSAILKETDKIAYLIFDNKVFSSMKGLQDNFEKGIITKAETIGELAESLEMDEKSLNDTIESWNKIVENKLDSDFGREKGIENDLTQAPYYAIKVSPAVHYTMGGLRINTNAQVLDKDGKSIEGFYAAGEVTGGLHGANRLGGNAVADIVIFGRQSGIKAANYAKDFNKIEVSIPLEEKEEITIQNQGNFVDGVYTGIGQGNNGEIKVEVEVKDKNIVRVTVLEHKETETIFKTVEEDLIKEIIEKQTIDIDAISGATNSSNGIKEALSDAFKK